MYSIRALLNTVAALLLLNFLTSVSAHDGRVSLRESVRRRQLGNLLGGGTDLNLGDLLGGGNAGDGLNLGDLLGTEQQNQQGDQQNGQQGSQQNGQNGQNGANPIVVPAQPQQGNGGQAGNQPANKPANGGAVTPPTGWNTTDPQAGARFVRRFRPAAPPQ